MTVTVNVPDVLALKQRLSTVTVKLAMLSATLEAANVAAVLGMVKAVGSDTTPLLMLVVFPNATVVADGSQRSLVVLTLNEKAARCAAFLFSL